MVLLGAFTHSFRQHSAEGQREALWTVWGFPVGSCPLSAALPANGNGFLSLCLPNGGAPLVSACVSVPRAITQKLSQVSKPGTRAAHIVPFSSLSTYCLSPPSFQDLQSYTFLYTLSRFLVISGGRVDLVPRTSSCLEAEVVSGDF